MKFILNNISRVSRYLFFVCLIGILVVSALPKYNAGTYEVSDGFSIRLDYFLHFLGYGALSAFFLLWRKDNWLRSLMVIIALGLFIAYITEFQQIFIVGRTYNPVDFYFNASGVIVGVLLSGFVRAWVPE